MWRKKRENELLALKFPFLSEDVREQISETQKLHKCSDTSDLVIDRLWNKFRSELRELLRERSGADRDIQSARQPLSDGSREIIRTYLDQALKYEGELMDEEDDAFEEMYSRTIVAIYDANRKRLEQLAQERDRWDFFNHPNAEVDFEKWRGRMLWPSQAVALSLGKDPEVVHPDSLMPYHRVARSPFREFFKYRQDLIEAAARAGKLELPISIDSFAAKASEIGIILPHGLLLIAGRQETQEEIKWREKYEACSAKLVKLQTDPLDANKKTMASIYTMLVGMAYTKFKWRRGVYSPGVAAIRTAVETAGLRIDDDTVDKHLNAAADTLDFKQP